jgi:TBCC domain-containing protein 1
MNAGTPSSNPIVVAREPPWLHVRREPFEYGILPLPSLLHNDVVVGLRTLRDKLLQQAPPISTWSLNNNGNNSSSSSIDNGGSTTTTTTTSGDDALVNLGVLSHSGGKRVATAAIAASLELSEAHAHLVLDSLASVLPEEGENVDPLAATPVTEIDSVGADVDDLLLYLYIQSYRRVPSRPHRDAAAVADVWPSTSAIDGFLPSISPLQARSASIAKRSMPCQAEEEVHQLAYVQKHLPSLLALLAESTEDEENGTKVIAAAKFEHLGLLLRAKDADMQSIPLSQAALFFANSDPAMPAAPVPVEQVLEWISLHICAASENFHQKPLVKENGPSDPVALSEAPDVTMMDAATSTAGSTGAQTIFLPNGLLQLSKDWRPEGLTFVDGVVRASVLKGEQDIKGGSLKASPCLLFSLSFT